jgi:OOP family OmpA-OmpF porin
MPRLAIGRSLSAVARLVACCALCAILTAARDAAAQSAGNLTLDAFRPAMDSRGYLTVNASQTLGNGEMSFGLGSLDWGHDLLELDAHGNTYSIDDMLTATLIAAVGLHLGPAELEVGASLPLRIMSGSRGPNSLGDPSTPNDDKTFGVDGQGLGNVGLHLKARLLRTDRGPHLGLALIGSLYLPTISPKDRFLGETQLVPQLVGVLDTELGKDRALRIALNGGVRLRNSTTFTNSDPGPLMAPVTDESITVGSELPFGAGVAYAIAKQRFDLVGEVFGALPLGAHQRYQPLEALAGVKLYLARNSFLTLGAGRGLVTNQGANPAVRAFIAIVFEPRVGHRDGDAVADEVAPGPAPVPEGVSDRDGDKIPDTIDKCPDEPEDYDGFQDEDGCPDPDNDGDKILDVDDLCPNAPEDVDGFEDEDGCPDLDNDHDRIPDTLDRCPNEPENYNGFQDDDGCPDHGVVERVVSGIVTMEPIQFEYNSAVIRRDSFYILDAVVATMNGNPDIALIEVQGHTDERGDDAYNLDLSVRRAAAVVSYLVGHGVAAKRLTSQGYGETQPIARGHTEAAWKQNRRVAFLLIKSDN